MNIQSTVVSTGNLVQSASFSCFLPTQNQPTFVFSIQGRITTKKSFHSSYARGRIDTPFLSSLDGLIDASNHWSTSNLMVLVDFNGVQCPFDLTQALLPRPAHWPNQNLTEERLLDKNLALPLIIPQHQSIGGYFYDICKKSGFAIVTNRKRDNTTGTFTSYSFMCSRGRLHEPVSSHRQNTVFCSKYSIMFSLLYIEQRKRQHTVFWSKYSMLNKIQYFQVATKHVFISTIFSIVGNFMIQYFEN
jgi:hypothetical protein